MSNEIVENLENKSGRGGARKGAGRKKHSGEKTKICVSVNGNKWQAAKGYWKEKPSWLVDRLIASYVQSGGSILTEAAAI